MLLGVQGIERIQPQKGKSMTPNTLRIYAGIQVELARMEMMKQSNAAREHFGAEPAYGSKDFQLCVDGLAAYAQQAIENQ